MLRLPYNPRTSQPKQSDRFLDTIRARFVRTLAYGALVVVWGLIFIEVVTPEVIAPNLAFTAPAVHVLAFFVLYFLRDNRFSVSLIYTMQIGLTIFIIVPANDSSFTMIAAAAVIIAAYTFNRLAYITFSLTVFAALAYRVVQNLNAGNEEFLIVAISGLITLSIASFGARYFSTTVQDFARRNQRNNELLQATAQVGQIANAILSQDELFRQAVELIRDRFDYYHVQIFLVDENRQYAALVASTGDVGRRLMARKHRLAVGSQSVIGRVTQVGEPIIARDTDRDPLHARNELLPNTRSELALPIFDGARIIGALDVQSTQSKAFQPEDVRSLEIMASQLGVAIRNARLFETQTSSVQENKRLFFESEANLREIQRLNRQLTQKTWRDFITSSRSLTGVTVQGDTLTSEGVGWSPSMLDAGLRRRPIVNAEKKVLAVPLVLRGEVIGSIEIETGDVPDEDAIETAQSVAGRLAISLDNARLFEEAQQGTLQEQRLNEIVGRYQSAATVDELLQITLTELNDVFGAADGKIRIGRLPKLDEPSGNGYSPNGDHHHD